MNIFITAHLRSGSSHVVETLSRLTGNNIGYLMPQFSGTKGNEENVISHTDIQCMTHQGKWIFHIHAKGSANHRYLLKAFHLKPVVLLRNIPDALVSVKEQLEVGAQFPGFTRPKNWSQLSENMKWQWIMVYIAPWFLDFERSWQNHPEALITTHRNMFLDPYIGYKAIFDHVGLEVPARSAILEHHNAHRTNFVTGVPNRGQSIPHPWLEYFNDLPK